MPTASAQNARCRHRASNASQEDGTWLQPRPALRFGALTFTFPFVLGLLLALPFDYGLATALLYGSLWASHTLVSYPVVQEHRVTRHRAVGMAAGGTVITDTLSLFISRSSSARSKATTALLSSSSNSSSDFWYSLPSVRSCSRDLHAGASSTWEPATHHGSSSFSRLSPRLRSSPTAWVSRESSEPSSPGSL
jgi:hypothetical protein